MTAPLRPSAELAAYAAKEEAAASAILAAAVARLRRYHPDAAVVQRVHRLPRLGPDLVRERDGGWELDGTLVGERHDPARHPVKILIKAVTYHGLQVVRLEGTWTASVVFDI